MSAFSFINLIAAANIYNLVLYRSMNTSAQVYCFSSLLRKTEYSDALGALLYSTAVFCVRTECSSAPTAKYSTSDVISVFRASLGYVIIFIMSQRILITQNGERSNYSRLLFVMSEADRFSSSRL